MPETADTASNQGVQSNIIKDALKEMLDNLKPELINTVKQMAKDSREEQNQSIDKIKKSLEERRKHDQIRFDKKGHEDQYRHSADVMEKIDQALEHLDENHPDKAHSALKEGKKLIKTRMKHIRLADREGWLAVQQFRSDELASDEEEEKRLKRAIKSANTIREKSSAKRQRTNEKSEPSSAQKITDKKKLDDVICYGCKRTGHFVTNCPFSNKETLKSSLRRKQTIL